MSYRTAELLRRHHVPLFVSVTAKLLSYRTFACETLQSTILELQLHSAVCSTAGHTPAFRSVVELRRGPGGPGPLRPLERPVAPSPKHLV